MTILGAQADGIANIAGDGTVLDTWYPEPALVERTAETLPPTGTVRLGAQDLSPQMLSLVGLDEDRMVEQVAVRTTIADLSEPPVDAHDVYLRLHLLSHRKVTPGMMNMNNILSLLSTVVWTNKGPCLPTNFEYVRQALRSRGLIHVYAVDRLPRMVDYVVPSGIRIAEAERVRLGAYLAPGTSVLREGFVSFNAGCLGPSKIEGRLSSSVVMGKDCKIGLSAVLMGLQDPHGLRLPLRIGDSCSFGVSSGVIGVDLGDYCHIGTNLVLEPDTLLYFPDTDSLAPAKTIAGQDRWAVTKEAGHPEPVARRVSIDPAA
ncbi:DapH/DapD/GlmU-related protein [Corynebacterium sp. H127]|uniref:DapH/DapD/GlmU-related protein n=1 Tax=Corynebacterium sp. H127 TaxID=3133418 RepID=UPI0030A3DFD9